VADARRMREQRLRYPPLCQEQPRCTQFMNWRVFLEHNLCCSIQSRAPGRIVVAPRQ